MFYCFKISSWKTGLQEKKHFEKLFVRKFIIVAKSFPQIQVQKNKYVEKILLAENVLWLQNHFLENMFWRKTYWEIFFVVIFYCCKFISSKTGLNKIAKFSWSIVICFKIISWKTGLQEKNILRNFFCSKIYYCCKIISPNTGSEEQICWENSFGRQFFMVAKSFPRKQVLKKKLLRKFFWS